MSKNLIVLFLINFSLFSFSQTENKKERNAFKEANKLYSEGKLEEAKEIYDNLYEENYDLDGALYNKANILFKQDSIEKAAGLYGSVASSTQDKKLKAKAYHNLGNSLYKNVEPNNIEQLKEVAEAYKNALINNPSDENSRYNYSIIKEKINQIQNQQKQKKQQQKQNQGKDKKEQEENQKKEKGDKPQDGQKGDKKDKKGQEGEGDKKGKGENGDQKDKDGKGGEQQKLEQGGKGIQKGKEEQRMSKGDGRRILKSLENEEKEAQEKSFRQKQRFQKGKQNSTNSDKDW